MVSEDVWVLTRPAEALAATVGTVFDAMVKAECIDSCLDRMSGSEFPDGSSY